MPRLIVEQPVASFLSRVRDAVARLRRSAINSQHDSQDRDADGFVVPPRRDSSQNGGAKKKGQESAATSQASMQSQLDSYIKITGKMQSQLDKLMQQLEESRKREERQRQEMDKLLQRLIGKAAN